MFLSVVAFMLSFVTTQIPVMPAGSGTKADPYRIDSLPNLGWISLTSSAWSSSFIQTRDIDASASNGWDAGAGFLPIGSYSSGFSGSYHGKGHKIANLMINRPDSMVVGLFGSLGYGASIDSLGLENCLITGGQSTGGLVGHMNGKISITRCWASGALTSRFSTVGNTYMNGPEAFLGGLVGDVNFGGSFVDCSASGDLTFQSTDTTLSAYVGGLVGLMQYGKIARCTSSTQIEGGRGGGLVGSSTMSRLDQDISTGRIHLSLGKASVNVVGGLAGGLVADSYYDTITGCRSNVRIAIGADSGTQNSAGGLVGNSTHSILKGSSASGGIEITSPSTIRQLNLSLGGLVGNNQSGSIQGCFAAGDLLGVVPVSVAFAGGLVGYNTSGTIRESYATGSLNVSADNIQAGGLVGSNYVGTVDGCYAMGGIAATSTGGSPIRYAGSLVGNNSGGSVVRRAYWDAESSGMAVACGLNGGACTSAGLTRTATRQRSKFDSLNFDTTWFLYENRTSPLLRSFLTPLVVTANDSTKGYDGLPFRGGNGVRYSAPVVDSLVKGNPVWSGTAQSAVDTGRYSIHADSLWSTQFGYLISYLDGSLRILPRALGVSGLVANGKVYDGTTLATLGGTASLDGRVGSDDVVLSGSASASFQDKRVGTVKTVVVGGLALAGSKAFDYVLAPILLQADIAPKPISIAGVVALDKVYDGTSQATLAGGNFVDTLAGDVLRLVSGVGSFADPNVGNAKAVSAAGFRIGGPDSSDYSLLAQPSGQTANITAYTVSVTAQPAVKALGTPDPALAYTASPLLDGDTWNGSLARDSGDTAGEYQIRIGSLSAGGNYRVEFQGARFTILTTTALASRPSKWVSSKALDAIPARIFAPATLGSARGVLEAGPPQEGDLSVDIVLPEPALVEVSIFDHLGSPVISWSSDISAINLHQRMASEDGRWTVPVRWNLRASNGKPVPVGVYLWKVSILGHSGAKLETVKNVGVR
jgi:hypothetical protein